MNNTKPYFPAASERFPDCDRCDRQNCRSRGMYQRGIRSLHYLAGRCPRLPDMWGHLEPEDAALKGMCKGTPEAQEL